MPFYSYSHNNTFSNYSSNAEGAHPIVNNARENANTFNLSGLVNKNFGKRHYLAFMATMQMMKTKVEYFGSSQAIVDFSDNFGKGGLLYTFYPNDRANIGLTFDVIYQNYKTNHYRDSFWSYFAVVQGQIMGMHNNNFSIYATYSLSPPPMSLRSPNIQQSNEFLYSTGNPLIGLTHNFNFTGGYNQNLSNQISYGVSARYNVAFNQYRDYYSLYDDGRALLRSYRNDGEYYYLSLTGNLSARLLSNHLTVQLSSSFNHARLTGHDPVNHTYFSANAYLQYYFDRFSIGGSYYMGSRMFNNWTGAYTSLPDTYSLETTCSLSPWILKLTAINFLSTKKRGERTVMDSQLYSSVSESFPANYRPILRLTAVYSFGYGKKVNDYNELTAPQENSSLILTK